MDVSGRGARVNVEWREGKKSFWFKGPVPCPSVKLK